MANALKLEVVAEGVERREQMLLLHRRGCRLMQRYYFSRPLPAADVTALLADLRAQGPRRDWRLADNRHAIALASSRRSDCAA